MDPAQDKGAFSWLTLVPVWLHTSQRGISGCAIALRYNWQPLHSPSLRGCGAKFFVEHALSHPKGGFHR